MDQRSSDGSTTTPPLPSAAVPEAPDAGAGHAGYRTARAALERAENAEGRQDFEGARREQSQALEALGKEYAPPEVDDDTSLKLAAADELWNQGRRADSISTRMRMLRTRLALYRQRHPSAPPEPRALALELEVNHPRSRTGEPLKLALTLRNTGSVPVFVNSRLALNSSHAPDAMREVVIDVHGPDGQLRPFSFKLKIGPADRNQVQALAPGASLHKDYELEGAFDLSTPGEYRLSALYASAPLADPNGAPVWTELIYGKEVRFTRE